MFHTGTDIGLGVFVLCDVWYGHHIGLGILVLCVK